VIIVGSGGAASAAAMLAIGNGAKVMLLERSATYGGTAIKSGGVYYVPNNPVMEAEGIEDPKEDAMRFLARGAYPDQYSPEGPTLGLSEQQYSLLEAYYDQGGGVIAELHDLGALQSTLWRAWNSEPFP